jgi:uncharacterized peroxidase-related enzyme
MSRIPLPATADATGSLKDSYDRVRALFGAVPNGVRTLGVSPEVLQGYLAFAGSLATGGLTPAERERVAIMTAQYNSCGYCLSAHTLSGRAAGVSDTELDASRDARSTEPRAMAILGFAQAVLESRGDLDDAVLAAAQDAGLIHSELVEIIANVSLNTLTNYVNRFIKPEHDLPASVPVERARVA